MLVHRKDKIDKAAKCRMVYDIQCPDCSRHYVGETVRPLAPQGKPIVSPTPTTDKQTQVELRPPVFNDFEGCKHPRR